MSGNSTTMISAVSNMTEPDVHLWQAERIQTTEWIAAECIAGVTTCFALYLVISLTYFEMRKRGIIVNRGLYSSEYSTTERENTKTGSPEKAMNSSPQKKKRGYRSRRKPSHEERYETWLRFLNLSAAVFAMLKCFSVQLDLIWGTQTVQICTGYAFSTVMLNGSSFISVYLLLWLRQWAVHSHPALQHLPVKTLRRLSWALLGAILLTFASLCVMFFVTIKVENSDRGCVFADEGTLSQGARSGSGIIFTVIFQPSLLALLCYPLMKHTLNRRRAFGLGTDVEGVNIRKPKDEGEAKIYRIIRRLVISVALVTVSDIGGVIGAFLLENHPIYYIGLVYDVNITFGAYVITWSFNNWKQRMLPFCSKKKKTNEKSSPIPENTNA